MARKRFDHATRVFVRLMGFTFVAAIILLGLLYAIDRYVRVDQGQSGECGSFSVIVLALVAIALILGLYGYYVSRRTGKDIESLYRGMLEEEREKTRIKHQMSTNINHEIKTPVHSAQGCLETIMMNGDRLDKEQILRFVEKSRQQLRRLCSLLNDVSTITRIADGAEHFIIESLDLRTIVADMEEDMEMQPEQNRMDIHVSLPPTMPIDGNRGLLEAVFHNLVSNAIAYSGGTAIFITLLDEDDSQYRFSFADNGRGIDPVHFGRLFERFYRLDEGRSRKIGGTGLGLSIVKNAVKFHGGEITVRNHDGGGLEFVFTLGKNAERHAVTNKTAK